MDPEKVLAVVEWPVPKSTTEVRSLVGLCAYYCCFIESFGEIAKPLLKLTEKNAKFSWSEGCQSAFDEL